jgi:hypothetical protein
MNWCENLGIRVELQARKEKCIRIWEGKIPGSSISHTSHKQSKGLCLFSRVVVVVSL